MNPFKLQNSASKTCQKNLLRENYYLMIKRLMARLRVLRHFLTFLKPQKVFPLKKYHEMMMCSEAKEKTTDFETAL